MTPRTKATWTRAVIAALALSVAVAPSASGAAGTGRLDKSFSRDGLRIHELAFRDEAHDVLVRPDGTIYTTGWLEGPSVQGVYVAAYRPDGRNKRSFGTNGRAVLDLGDYFLLGMSLLRQSNGKLVIAGPKGLSSDETLIARFHPDGRRDMSFSGNGYHVQDLAPGGSDYVEDLVVMPDGDIMLVGWTTGPTIFLARFNPNGTPDTGFGTGGYLLIDGTGSEIANAAIRQGSKILLAGRYEGMPAVLRVNGAGELDDTFGVAGVSKLSVPGDLSSIARQRNGRIVVGGGSGGSGLAARMLASGTLDNSFGTGGVAQVADLTDQGAGLTIQPRGRLVLSGNRATPGGEIWTVIRLTRRGKPDPSFSGDGTQTTDLPKDLARPYALATQRDGKALSVGMSGGSGSEPYNSTLIRYRGDSWIRALRVRKRRDVVRVSGLQFPFVAGQEVLVSLLRRSRGRFRLLDRNVANLGSRRDPDRDGFDERPFGTRFDRPGSGRCRIVAVGRSGPGYAVNRVKKTFAC